jgi:hypothetical protein
MRCYFICYAMCYVLCDCEILRWWWAMLTQLRELRERKGEAFRWMVPARKSQKRSLTQKAVSSPPQWMASAAWVKLSYSLHLHCQLQLSECCCSLSHPWVMTCISHRTSVTLTRWSRGTGQNSSMMAFQAIFYIEMLWLSHCSLDKR